MSLAPTIVCIFCGKDAPNNGGGQKYCLSCVTNDAMGRNRSYQEMRKAIRKGRLPPAKNCICVDCGNPVQQKATA